MKQPHGRPADVTYPSVEGRRALHTDERTLEEVAASTQRYAEAARELAIQARPS